MGGSETDGAVQVIARIEARNGESIFLLILVRTS